MAEKNQIELTFIMGTMEEGLRQHIHKIVDGIVIAQNRHVVDTT